MSVLLLTVLAAPHLGESPAASRLTFEAALEAADRHPAVRAARARLSARRVLDDGLGALATDPQVIVQPGVRFAAPGGGRDGLDGSVGLQQSFNLHDWGGARRDAAAAEREVLHHRTDAVLRAARRRAARVWLQTWELAQELELRHRMQDEAAALMRQADRRVELGMGQRLEHAQARAFLAQARLRVLDAEGRLFEAGLDLAAACGESSGPVYTSEDLPELALPPDLRARLDIDHDPEVLTARARTHAARERTTEAAAQDGWQLLTGVQVATEPPGDVISSATLGVTLPVSGRNRRSTAQQGADQAAARDEEDATVLRMSRMRAGALHEVEHTRDVASLYRSDLIPARREEVAALTRELELGGVPLQRVLDARIRLLDAEIEAARAEGRYRAAIFDLKMILSSEEEPRS